MIAEKYQKIRFEAGVAEERARWTEWNRRRLDAEQRDEEFTEPPPASGDTNGAHNG